LALEHLLLGLLREDKALTCRFVGSDAPAELIRKRIEGKTLVREDVSTSVDLPLSKECKRVLKYAPNEADRLSHKHIGTEHLMLGLLCEEKCFAAELLRERGVAIEELRKEFAKASWQAGSSRPMLRLPKFRLKSTVSEWMRRSFASARPVSVR
jgi:ATP-dependent Clp protease ATP-binding subunit ClpC